MARIEQASIQITVYEMPGVSIEAIKNDINERLSKKYYGASAEVTNTPDMFVGTNCGAEVTFSIIFGMSCNNIPSIEEIVSFLESINSELFKLGIIYRNLKRYYRYI